MHVIKRLPRAKPGPICCCAGVTVQIALGPRQIEAQDDVQLPPACCRALWYLYVPSLWLRSLHGHVYSSDLFLLLLLLLLQE